MRYVRKGHRLLADFTRMGNNEILDFAGRLARNEKGEAIYNFGKHKGKTLEQVDSEEPGYYGWMLYANFPLYTKKVLKDEMEKIKAKRLAAKPNIVDQMNALKSKFMG